MADSEQVRAQRIFKALCALDPTPTLRKELRASGVSEHTIETLYPLPEGFVALEPYLIEHVARIADEQLLTEAAGTLDQRTLPIWNALPKHLSDESDRDGERDDELVSELKETFENYLAARFEQSQVEVPLSPAIMARLISQAAWAAHWFMSHQDEMALWDSETPMSTASDRLMIEVGDLLHLLPEGDA